MQRFRFGQKPVPVEIKTDSKFWGTAHPGFEPYQQERKLGKHLTIIQQTDNSKLTFFIEDRSGRTIDTFSEKAGIEAWHKALEKFDYLEQNPSMINQGQQPAPAPGTSQEPQLSKEDQKIKELTDKVEKSQAEHRAMMQAKKDKYTLGMAKFRMEELKETMEELQQTINVLTPDKPDNDGTNDKTE